MTTGRTRVFTWIQMKTRTGVAVPIMNEYNNMCQLVQKWLPVCWTVKLGVYIFLQTDTSVTLIGDLNQANQCLVLADIKGYQPTRLDLGLWANDVRHYLQHKNQITCLKIGRQWRKRYNGRLRLWGTQTWSYYVSSTSGSTVDWVVCTYSGHSHCQWHCHWTDWTLPLDWLVCYCY